MMDSISAPGTLRLGTRGSALARWQTDYVAARLQQAWPDLALVVEVMRTQGDKVLDAPLPLIGGKGLFTAELEAALHSGAIDLAVHSLKDLPTALAAGLVVGAIPARADARDVLISRSGRTLEQLPPGSTIGTSSRRRAAQIRHRFPHLQMIDIRGNVDTRIRKALDPTGPYDATVLAFAGVERLAHSAVITEVLPFALMLPAPGQGALAVQCRDEQSILARLTPLDDAETRVAVTAERAFLEGLGGGCSVPVAAYAWCVQERLFIRGRVGSENGEQQVEVELEGLTTEAAALGAQLAQLALAEGADVLLRAWA
jgi:hydroxymethylbilane synthase